MEKVKSSTLGWIYQKAKKFVPAIFLLTTIGVMIAFVSVRFALASRDILDCVTGKSDLKFIDCVASLVVLLLIQLGLEIFYTLFDVRVRNKLKNKLQNELFHTVLTRDYLEGTSIHSGEMMNRLTSDIDVLYTNIIDIIPGTAALSFGVIFSVVAMFRLDKSLTIICLALGPVVMASSVLYGKRMKELYKKCHASDGRTRSFMLESIQNILAIKAFCKENLASKYASVLQHENYKLNMKRGAVSVVVNIIYFFSLTAAYYFAVAWCAYKISLGVMTVGVFTAIAQLVGQIQSPFKDLASVIPKYFATCASAERIMEVEQIASDYVSNSDFQSNDKFEKIIAHDLTFRYEDKTILQNADFEIKKGQTIVIKGLSGIGKSTFMKLLLGVLKAESGSLDIVDGNGQKTSICGSTRCLFAYVPQGNMILSGSIKENVSFFDEDTDDARLSQALKDACAMDFVNLLPDGKDAVVGEGGSGLSEGQVQRIAVARAFYSDAPIILLDEATSALDEKTETAILKSIKNMQEKTCIIITHKHCAEEFADVVLTLENCRFSVSKK